MKMPSWDTPASLILPMGPSIAAVTLREAVLAFGRLSAEDQSRAQIDYRGDKIRGTLGTGAIKLYLSMLGREVEE
jgi:hypothetical protein